MTVTTIPQIKLLEILLHDAYRSTINFKYVSQRILEDTVSVWRVKPVIK
jgi:hypothetical protein